MKTQNTKQLLENEHQFHYDFQDKESCQECELLLDSIEEDIEAKIDDSIERQYETNGEIYLAR